MRKAARLVKPPNAKNDLSAADKALNHAKSGGRNKVVISRAGRGRAEPRPEKGVVLFREDHLLQHSPGKFVRRRIYSAGLEQLRKTVSLS